MHMPRLSHLVSVVVACVAGCGDDERLAPPDAAADGAAMAAVVSVEMAGTLRLRAGGAIDAIAPELIDGPSTSRGNQLLEWAARLQAAEAANYATFIYLVPVDVPGWHLALGTPSRDGEIVVVPWTLSGAIHVFPEELPDVLDAEGETLSHDITVAADPRHLLAVIGTVCANEFTVPQNNVTDENYHKFFDGELPGCAEALAAGPGQETVTLLARREPDGPPPAPTYARTVGAADLRTAGPPSSRSPGEASGSARAPATSRSGSTSAATSRPRRSSGRRRRPARPARCRRITGTSRRCATSPARRARRRSARADRWRACAGTPR
jgi:hypothetical protein